MKGPVLEGINRRRRGKEPVLLLLDGHSSRINPPLWRIFQQEGIDVVILPSHSSLYLQPLDLGCNAELKRQLTKALLTSSASSAAEARAEFLLALYSALHAAHAPTVVRGAWGRSGMHPVNPSVLMNLWANPLETPTDEPDGARPPTAVKSMIDLENLSDLPEDQLKAATQRIQRELQRRRKATKSSPSKAVATKAGPLVDLPEFGSLTTPTIRIRTLKSGREVEYFEYSAKLVTDERILAPWEAFIARNAATPKDLRAVAEEDEDVDSDEAQVHIRRKRSPKKTTPAADGEFRPSGPPRGRYRVQVTRTAPTTQSAVGSPSKGQEVQEEIQTGKLKRSIRLNDLCSTSTVLEGDSEVLEEADSEYEDEEESEESEESEK
jgi:hypothetical protein